MRVMPGLPELQLIRIAITLVLMAAAASLPFYPLISARNSSCCASADTSSRRDRTPPRQSMHSDIGRVVPDLCQTHRAGYLKYIGYPLTPSNQLFLADGAEARVSINATSHSVGL